LTMNWSITNQIFHLKSNYCHHPLPSNRCSTAIKMMRSERNSTNSSKSPSVLNGYKEYRKLVRRQKRAKRQQQTMGAVVHSVRPSRSVLSPSNPSVSHVKATTSFTKDVVVDEVPRLDLSKSFEEIERVSGTRPSSPQVETIERRTSPRKNKVISQEGPYRLPMKTLDPPANKTHAPAADSPKRMPIRALDPPIRKKSERAKLDGYECNQCVRYYAQFNLPPEELRKRLKNCSRHRARWEPNKTQPGFWDIDFPPTQECIERGYMLVADAKDDKQRPKKWYLLNVRWIESYLLWDSNLDSRQSNPRPPFIYPILIYSTCKKMYKRHIPFSNREPNCERASIYLNLIITRCLAQKVFIRNFHHSDAHILYMPYHKYHVKSNEICFQFLFRSFLNAMIGFQSYHHVLDVYCNHSTKIFAIKYHYKFLFD